jgi:hypothetical protein
MQSAQPPLASMIKGVLEGFYWWRRRAAHHFKRLKVPGPDHIDCSEVNAKMWTGRPPPQALHRGQGAGQDAGIQRSPAVPVERSPVERPTRDLGQQVPSAPTRPRNDDVLMSARAHPERAAEKPGGVPLTSAGRSWNTKPARQSCTTPSGRLLHHITTMLRTPTDLRHLSAIGRDLLAAA